MPNKVGIIIQARYTSNRLQGKSLMMLGSSTLIQHVYTNASKSKYIDECVVAIPDNKENSILEKFLKKNSIPFITGSEDNLIDRHLKVAERFNLNFIVRVPGDNPFPHATEIDRIIEHHLSHNREGFSTNLSPVFESGYPDGIGAEIFSIDRLLELDQEKSDACKLEHLHLNFLDYKSQISCGKVMVSTIKCPSEFARPDIRLDINTRLDYDYFCEMFKYFGKSQFDIRDIIFWHDNFAMKNSNLRMRN